jgi:hypothetical protein
VQINQFEQEPIMEHNPLKISPVGSKENLSQHKQATTVILSKTVSITPQKICLFLLKLKESAVVRSVKLQ